MEDGVRLEVIKACRDLDNVMAFMVKWQMYRCNEVASVPQHRDYIVLKLYDSVVISVFVR